MNPRTRALLVVLACAGPACRPDQARAPSERTSTASTASTVAPPVEALQQDTSFTGTMAPVQRIRSLRAGVARPVLREVTGWGGPGDYDRFVFEFTGDSVPGYRVEYTTKPVQRCGSGDPVSVEGTGRLIVRFEPAQAHDEHSALPLEARHRVPELLAVREMILICDFEGQVTWLLGIAAPSAYRVSELTRPARLVLDVRHAP